MGGMIEIITIAAALATIAGFCLQAAALIRDYSECKACDDENMPS